MRVSAFNAIANLCGFQLISLLVGLIKRKTNKLKGIIGNLLYLLVDLYFNITTRVEGCCSM